jgi:hypothetical protein
MRDMILVVSTWKGRDTHGKRACGIATGTSCTHIASGESEGLKKGRRRNEGKLQALMKASR